MTNVEPDVRSVLERDPAVESVVLTGSRARGDAMPYSDWDFKITTNDFPRVAQRLPELVAPLGPLGQFWDPLAPEWCYILMIRGPFGVDLIFDEPHDPDAPWTVTAETLPRIDTHFWNWVWWLSTKDRHGAADRVAEELAKMHWFLLGPLGADSAPRGIADAVQSYLARRNPSVAGELEADVLAGLRRVGYDV